MSPTLSRVLAFTLSLSLAACQCSKNDEEVSLPTPEEQENAQNSNPRRGAQGKRKRRRGKRADAQRSNSFDKEKLVRRQKGLGHVTSAEPSSDEQRLAMELQAIGYVDGVVESTGRTEIEVKDHQPSKRMPGWNFTSTAGHPIALLVDPEGNERHRWTFSLTDAWPTLKMPGQVVEKTGWRRAELQPNGDLIGIWSGFGIVRINAASSLVWGNFIPVHHDFEVNDDGSIIVLTREGRVIDDLWPGEEVMEDSIAYLDAEGKVTRQFSVVEAFMKHPDFKRIWKSRREPSNPDIFHTNTLFLLRKDHTDVHPAFKKGHLLTSMRSLNAIAIIDPEAEEVTWAMKDIFATQHDPQILDNGHMMIYDNTGLRLKASRILEYTFPEGTLSWQYADSPETPFSSVTCGHAQRLPNGNTLINEANQGRAFEVTPEGEMVWEYFSPFESEDKKLTLLSRIFEFKRLEADFPLQWAQLPPESAQ